MRAIAGPGDRLPLRLTGCHSGVGRRSGRGNPTFPFCAYSQLADSCSYVARPNNSVDGTDVRPLIGHGFLINNDPPVYLS